MHQEFYHGPAADAGGGDRLGPRVPVGPCRLVLADELPQVPVAADLARARVMDHYLAWPHRL